MIGEVKDNLDLVFALCLKYNVQTFEVFGSALHEDSFDESESDLDFLVEFLPMDPVDHAKNYFSLLEDLKELFNRNVDLVESRAIKNPYFLDAINKERERIYAA